MVIHNHFVIFLLYAVVLNGLVFNVWFWKEGKMKNWRTERRGKGGGFLNPLEVASVRWGGLQYWERCVNSVCPPPCLLFFEQKQKYLEDRVLFAHLGSHWLCGKYTERHS